MADLRLLLDANLSPTLAGNLRDVFPRTEHLLDHLKHDTVDPVIWRFARDNGFTTIVTCDVHFDGLFIANGPPPLVVRLRLGHRSLATIEHVLRVFAPAIVQMHDEPFEAGVSRPLVIP